MSNRFERRKDWRVYRVEANIHKLNLHLMGKVLLVNASNVPAALVVAETRWRKLYGWVPTIEVLRCDQVAEGYVER